MNRGSGVWAAAALLVLTPARAVAELPIDGIAIGASVRALAETLGPPANVTSADDGNLFVFGHGTTVYTDDDGVVLAVETRTGSPRIEIDGTVHSFDIGTYSAKRADAELADVAEFTTPARRSYRIAPRRDLVFGFSDAQRLERVIYGEPGQLVRLGLLPGDAAVKAVIYRAPRPRRLTLAAPAGPRTTVYRISIDRAGAVRDVDIMIGSSVEAADADLARRLHDDRFVPATLDGRPIAATIFVELHH